MDQCRGYQSLYIEKRRVNSVEQEKAKQLANKEFNRRRIERQAFAQERQEKKVLEIQLHKLTQNFKQLEDNFNLHVEKAQQAIRESSLLREKLARENAERAKLQIQYQILAEEKRALQQRFDIMDSQFSEAIFRPRFSQEEKLQYNPESETETINQIDETEDFSVKFKSYESSDDEELAEINKIKSKSLQTNRVLEMFRDS